MDQKPSFVVATGVVAKTVLMALLVIILTIGLNLFVALIVAFPIAILLDILGFERPSTFEAFGIGTFVWMCGKEILNEFKSKK